MYVKIPLRLRGVDLRDADAFARIDPELTDLFFEANGGVSLAVLYTDDPDPVWVAADAARRISKLMPGVTVAEAHDELVATADIAARCQVAPEAVRLWAVGKRRAHLRPFPVPRQVVGAAAGGKTMSLYAWREVLSWVREVIGIDADEGVAYLDDAQLAHLNAELATARDWSSVDAMTRRLSSSNAAVAAAHAKVMRSMLEPSQHPLLPLGMGAAGATPCSSLVIENVEVAAGRVPAAAYR